jgi:hypothetical protein
MKTNRPIKKGDNKWAGPYCITEIYPQVCHVQLPNYICIFPVFHNYLLCYKDLRDIGLPSQAIINEIKLQHICGHILEREDSEIELVEKWEFEKLLDCHNEDGLYYLLK